LSECGGAGDRGDERNSQAGDRRSTYAEAMSVRLKLPLGHETGFRSSLRTLSSLVVTDLRNDWVSIDPAEGAGVTSPYFSAHRLADKNTDLSDARTWDITTRYPPWNQKPHFEVPEGTRASHDALYQRSDIGSIIKRLGTEVLLSSPKTLSAVLSRELPELFRRYPFGSLWYVTVSRQLSGRLALMRVSRTLRLTPDVDYDKSDGIQYFGLHSLTQGSDFSPLVYHPLLAIQPVTSGFAMGVFPPVAAFLFGGFEDIRKTYEVPAIVDRFMPRVGGGIGGRAGIHFPAQGMSASQLESLFAWWTGRLNILYSHAADPTRFDDGSGVYDPVAQSAWFFTLERMLADASTMLAAVDTPPLMRMQIAFDLLDKVDSLLMDPKPNKLPEGKDWKRLLRDREALPALERAFDQLPVQLRPRFKQWAKDSYRRFYDDIKKTTMRSRVKDAGVMVAVNDPTELQRLAWDEYVPALMRAARNSSHGLLHVLSAPAAGSAKRDPRLLLATNSGAVPESFYEVATVIFFGLMSDAERFCSRTFWER
jgi:hypothetical protein